MAATTPETSAVAATVRQIASHAQLGLEQLDVFAINANGQLIVYWLNSGGWNGPSGIGPTGLFATTAFPIAGPQFGLTNQTDAFAVDKGGEITVAWVTAGGPWSGPVGIGFAEFASGTPLATHNQVGLPNQTDVYAVNTSGVLTVMWVTSASSWSGPSPISGAVFPPLTHVAASRQFGLNQTDVFAVNKSGALTVSWVTAGGPWSGPEPISPSGKFPAGAPIAAGQQIGLTQTDVFAIDNSGSLTVTWVTGGGAWDGPEPLSPSGTFLPGSAVATSQQFGLNQTDVFCVDRSGALTVSWVTGGGSWSGPVRIGPTGLASPGAPLSASQLPGQNTTVVVLFDTSGRLTVFKVTGDSAWVGPTRP